MHCWLLRGVGCGRRAHRNGHVDGAEEVVDVVAVARSRRLPDLLEVAAEALHAAHLPERPHGRQHVGLVVVVPTRTSRLPALHLLHCIGLQLDWPLHS